MRLSSSDFQDGQPIPEICAFCRLGEGAEPVAMSANRSPQLTWGEVPAGTASFVLTCIDGDVPSRGDDVNQAGREVPADLPRTDFVHWLLANVPASCRELAQGSCSDGVSPRGKRNPPGPSGARHGRNDYTGWFAGDPAMAGTYLGYDGPCPPWNDSVVHRYRFTVYALDLARLELPDVFGRAELEAATRGHVLGEASLVGTYTLNRRLRGA